MGNHTENFGPYTHNHVIPVIIVCMQSYLEQYYICLEIDIAKITVTAATLCSFYQSRWHIGPLNAFIIPYLEKIKGCLRSDIFRIRPWARHSRIISDSECVFLCRCKRITIHFPPHALTHSCIFRATEAGLNKLFCLFLCLLSARFVGSKSSHFAV